MSIAMQKPLDKIKYIPKGRDPPGQKAIYIIPGDPWVETYRAGTFKQFPYEADFLSLATNGFYFTGYRDRIKCFSCGMAVENWETESLQNFLKWHEPECDFLNGRDQSNQPMRRLFLQKAKRRTGQLIPTNPSTSRNNTRTQHSPSAGEVLFSDIGNNSNGQQSNSIAPEINPVVHEREVRNANSFSNDNDEDAELQQRRELFPCQNPINPHMRSSDVRFQTFIDRSDVWPQHRINATPQEISEAGFFYLGERDRVKCWYCNGGLQNFERNDQAWEEHGKWFPMCEYLLQQKGPEFVHNIVSRYPNLRRPALHNPARNVTFNGAGVSVRLAANHSTPSSSCPEIIDPRKQQEEQRQKIDRDMASSDLIANARLMGYSDQIIRSAVKSQYQLHNKGFSNCESLVNAILLAETDEHIDNENASNSTKSTKKSSKKSKLEDLLESKKCRVCHDEDACMVFIPCGHLPCCSKCGAEVKKCPICRSEISQRIRSYIS